MLHTEDLKQETKKKNNKKTAYEFSKKFAIVILIVTIIITIYACIMMYMSGDMSALPVIITCIYAELATGTGFYYSKAKSENKIKLKQDLIISTIQINKLFDVEDVKKATELIEKAEAEIDLIDLDNSNDK